MTDARAWVEQGSNPEKRGKVLGVMAYSSEHVLDTFEFEDCFSHEAGLDERCLLGRAGDFGWEVVIQVQHSVVPGEHHAVVRA